MQSPAQPARTARFWRHDIAPVALVFCIVFALIWFVPRSSAWQTPVFSAGRWPTHPPFSSHVIRPDCAAPW
jgi:hypothetical protein